MKGVLALLLSSALWWGTAPSHPSPPNAAQQQPRIAVIELLPFPEEAALHQRLIELIGAGQRFKLIDDDFVRTSMAGSAIDLTLNMTRDQSVGAGQLFGCEYFLLDRYFAITRRGLEGATSGESLLVLFLVDGRSGELVRFEAVHDKALTESEAAEHVRSRVSEAVKKLLDAAVRFEQERDRPGPAASAEIFHLPDEGSSLSSRLLPPKILEKKPPVYPALAQDAEITATVRLEAQFLLNGTIGEVRVERWAGYGLDEAAMTAARSIEFQPATLDGKPVSVVAPLEYHFRVGAGTRK